MSIEDNNKGGNVSLSKLSPKRQLVVPEDICKILGAESGDYIEFVQQRNEIVIKAKKLVDARSLEQQAKPLTWDNLKSDVPAPASKQEILNMLKDLQGDAEDDSGDIDIDLIKASRTSSDRIVQFD